MNQQLRLVQENQQLISEKLATLEAKLNQTQKQDRRFSDVQQSQHSAPTQQPNADFEAMKLQNQEILRQLRKLEAQCQHQDERMDLQTEVQHKFQNHLNHLGQLHQKHLAHYQNLLVDYDKELRQQIVKLFDNGSANNLSGLQQQEILNLRQDLAKL